MKYDRVIIEPHADDAFLSLAGHMKAWAEAGDSVLLATVYGSKARMKESAAFAKKIGADHHALGIPEGGAVDHLDPSCRLTDDRPEIMSLRPLIKRGQIYIPLGLQHAEHKEVRRYFDLRGVVNYYLDTPYYVKPSNADEVQNAVEWLQVQSILRPHASKWNAHKLFVSQSKFFHFNPVKNFHNVPEVVLWNP